MSVGQSISDVLRTAIIWGTVALLGYFGFQLVRAKFQNPAPQIVSIGSQETETLRADLGTIRNELLKMSKRFSDELSEMNKRLSDEDRRIAEARTVQESFEVSMLVAKNEGDKVHVFGRLRCRHGTWKSVKLAFTFRGKHHDVKVHRYHYQIPQATDNTPMDAGLWYKFDFNIPKLDPNWQEGSVAATIIEAEPA